MQEQSLKASSQWLILRGRVSMDESFDWDSLTFSLTPTDTMYLTSTKADEPWMPGELRPYGDIPMSPAAGVLNYGQGLFEGMKAYRTSKGRIVFFRPEENARRMQRGADRLKMPPVPESVFIDAVEQVVAANQHWVPPSGQGAMYVRPLLMGSGPVLGVSPAPSYTFLIYVTPVGPYFKGGMMAIDLLISENHHRAAPGGSGGVKATATTATSAGPALCTDTLFHVVFARLGTGTLTDAGAPTPPMTVLYWHWYRHWYQCWYWWWCQYWYHYGY